MLFQASPPSWLHLVQAVAAGVAALGVFALFGQVWIGWRRHIEQTKADRERRITESFAQAVEQLGSDKLETRLGAIYTFQRIAGESDREYWPIMEILTAFVREHRPWEKGAPPTKPTGAIQSALTVLTRRDQTNRNEYCKEGAVGRCLDLGAIDLRLATLDGAHFERAKLRGTHFDGANLQNAHFQAADLVKASLKGADVGGAHFDDALVCDANLQALALTRKQLESARGNRYTILHDYDKAPPHWLGDAPPAD